VARIAEGMPREPLLEVWRRFAWGERLPAGGQAAAAG
jgi:hypothetical protein